jgi:hypothetical protein
VSTTGRRSVLLAGRGLDDDVVLSLDVDAVRAQVRRDGQGLAIASDNAEAAAQSSCEFLCVLQVEPDELATNCPGAVERRPHVLKRLRDLRVVCHCRASSLAGCGGSTPRLGLEARVPRRLECSAWEASRVTAGMTWTAPGVGMTKWSRIRRARGSTWLPRQNRLAGGGVLVSTSIAPRRGGLRAALRRRGWRRCQGRTHHIDFDPAIKATPMRVRAAARSAMIGPV